jgi:D-methionine transport system substrate-binding protein
MRWQLLIGVALVALIWLGGANAEEKIVVGTVGGADEEILEKVRALAKPQGLDVKIIVFGDYVMPNQALAEKEIDVNSFQHLPFLHDFVAVRQVNLVSLGTTYLSPLGVYSKKIRDLKNLRAGDTVAIPNDATNEGRALLLLQKAGVIKLGAKTRLTATPIDLAENPLHLKFVEMDAAQTPRALDDAVAAVINTNFAIPASLNPTKDAIYLEGVDSPYVNVIAARADNQNDPKCQQFVKIYRSQPVADFILQRYGGSTLPAFPYQRQ